MRRILSVLLAAVGVLLLVAAAVVRFAVAPAKAVLPGNTDTTRTYTGAAAALFNPAALTGTGAPVLRNVPVTVTHHTRVLDTKGDSALVSDAKVVTLSGKAVAGVDYRYAVNRTDLGAGSGFADVVTQKGVTFNWPIRTEKKDYVGWVSDTHATTTLRYTGSAKRGGVTTYVYKVSTAAAPITDSQVLKALPRSLPKATLVQLATQLGLPAATLTQLQAILPSLPDPVPFTYTYRVVATYWIEPSSGIVVDLVQRDIRTLMLPIGGKGVPVTPVMDLTFRSPSATLAAAASDAKDKGGAVNLVYFRLPLWLAIGGGVLIVGGIGALAIGRRGTRGPGLTGSHETIQPVGAPK